MNKFLRSNYFVFIFILLFSTLSLIAQKPDPGFFPPLAEDTAINPHDFNNRVYTSNGIKPKTVIGRLTGSDGLSVLSNSSNPDHTLVRVLITLPAYDQYGGITFWYPLGEVRDNGFTEDKVGWQAKQTAKLFPMYIFPDPGAKTFNSFTNSRQAPIIDASMATSGPQDTIPGYPFGLREIIVVNYTEKAHGKEGVEMMSYFGKKNGFATDGTPLIKSTDDILYLQKSDMITMETIAFDTVRAYGGQYSLSTVIADPTKGVIAKDAFLWMSSIEGKQLPGEEMFVWQFDCLQKTGDWCQQ